MASTGSTLNPLGFFVAPSALGPPSPLLADNVDPRTKDFASLDVGSDPTDDAVQVALMTNRGSGGSVLQVGIKLGRSKMTADLPQVLEGDVRQALKTLTTNKDIDFKRITFGGPDATGEPSGTVDNANQAAQLNIEYRNLRAFDTTSRTLPLVAAPQIQAV